MSALPLIGYIATIIAANWAISTFGFVSVGFGLSAPAGVYDALSMLSIRLRNLYGTGNLKAYWAGADLSEPVS